MSLINRDTDYAIRAISFIAKNGNTISSADDLVRNLRISRPFLRKILQVLNKEKILKSYKGKKGGFVLAVPPKKVFVIDLMKIFQKGLKLKNCLLHKRICPNLRTCALRRKLNEIEEYVAAELKALSIASLCE